jgi:signal transduction histidine kinase
VKTVIKKQVLLLALCLSALIMQAQGEQEDKKAGSALIGELIEWANSLRFSDPQKALAYLERAQQIAEKESDRRLQAEVSQSMSIYFYARGDFDKALDCDKKTLTAYKSLNDMGGMAYAHNGVAVTLSDMGYHHEALNNYIEAELLMNQLGDSVGLQMVYVNMGVALDYLRDFKGALELYHKSLNIGLALDLYDELGDVFNNMAEAYMQLGDYQVAYGYYLKAQDIYNKTDQIEGKVMIKGNVAEYYRITKDFESAEPLYLAAIEEYGALQNNHGKCINLLGVGKLYSDSKKFDDAENYLNEALKLARQHRYVNELIEAQRELATISYLKKNYEKAYEYFQAYDAAKDSIYIASRNVEYDRLRRSFEADRNQHELEALQLQRDKDLIISDQKDRWGYALLIIVVMLLGFSVSVALLYQRLRRTNALLEKNGEDLVQKNNEIAKQTRQLQVANAKLLSEKKLAEISSEAKAEFVSVLSHEIRTPLNAIIGLSHLLKTEVQAPEHKKHIDALSYSAENLMGFTTNILELSRLDAGKIELQKEAFNLPELLERIKHTFEPALLGKNLSITINYLDDLPHEIIGDRVRLTQILLNLISNAIKYTEKGGVRVEIEKCRSVNKVDKDVSLCFMIIDSGIGIEYNLQDKVFDRYSRLQKESTLTPQGTGLGLSIAKSLVELLGGEITFSSQPGEGSTFKVKLNFELPERTNSKQDESKVQVAFEENILAGKHVLLVEDNPVNILFTKKILTGWGIIVDIAENGRIAVEKASATYFDLILMDLQMPEMNGIDASKAIAEFLPDVPIVALTANADGDTSRLLEHAPMCDLLEKPFRPDELKAKLLRWLFIDKD